MANLIAFFNAFLSYLLLFALCAAVVSAAVWIGITLRKRKDAATAADAHEKDR